MKLWSWSTTFTPLLSSPSENRCYASAASRSPVFLQLPKSVAHGPETAAAESFRTSEMSPGAAYPSTSVPVRSSSTRPFLHLASLIL